MSVAADSLSDRSNTGDNTPAFVEVSQRPGKGAPVHVMLKGGGSDNVLGSAMLDPSAGQEGTVEMSCSRRYAPTRQEHARRSCSVSGVGGTFDTVAKLAKRALLRADRQRRASLAPRDWRRACWPAVNATGIGPAGLGGDTTALAVHVQSAPSHIASLPVAVNMGCCAVRSVSVDVD